MLITFKRLILELTRQCNMRCAHCMRGEPEDKTIGTSILERLFREVRHIEHLGLTGGEPALVPEQIEWIVHLAKRWGCTIGHFFCATNGRRIPPNLQRPWKSCTAIASRKTDAPCPSVSTSFMNRLIRRRWNSTDAFRFISR